MSMIVGVHEGPLGSEFADKFYVAAEGVLGPFARRQTQYLYADGTWHLSCRDRDGVFRGYFPTREKAAETLRCTSFSPVWLEP